MSTFDVADGIIVRFQTDRIGIGLRLGIFCRVPFLIKTASLLPCFSQDTKAKIC